MRGGSAFLVGREHAAEGEIDAGGGDLGGFGEAVLPVGLGFVAHFEEAAVFEEEGDGFPGFLVAEAKAAFGTEAEGGDGGVWSQGGFVIAVPGHALVAVLVEIEEAGVESGAGVLLDGGLEGLQAGAPDPGLFGGTGVGVGDSLVREPGDLPGGDDASAEEDDLVVLPGDVFEEVGEDGPGFGRAEDGAVVADGAVAGEEVGGGGWGEEVHGGSSGGLVNVERDPGSGESGGMAGGGG